MASTVIDRTGAPGDVQPLRDEARLGGIRDRPTLDAVDRRRSQLWTLVFAGLVALAAGIAVLASGTVGDLGIAGTLPFRIGTVWFWGCAAMAGGLTGRIGFTAELVLSA